jgi:hypothetical protein
MICSPGHLWAIVKDFHQTNNKANLYLLQPKIEKLQQDFKTSISAHIDAFTQLKNKLLHRGCHVDESHLGRQMSACYYVRANLTKVTYKQIKRDIITKTH